MQLIIFFLSELNPIERAWAQVKRFVSDRNGKFNMNEVKSLTEEGIQSVSASNWQKYINKAIREENEYAELDNLDILEKCNIVVKPVTIADIDCESSDDSDWVTDDDSENLVNSDPQTESNVPPLPKITYESETVSVLVETPPEILKPPCGNAENNADLRCYSCDHNFDRKVNLDRHLQTLKKCNRCDKMFCGKRSNTRLKSHQKYCGGINLGFVCEQCGKTFKFQCRYISHTKSCGQLFQCKKCNQNFKFKVGLTKHKCTKIL